MNEERLKVLKMLKEGRITMEEAELLLDALSASGERHEEQESSDRARTHAHEDAESSQRSGSSRNQGFFGGWGPGGLFNSEWKMDPSIFQSGLKEAMKGFEQSMKEFASEFGKRDFAGGFKEFFGRSSGQASKSVRFDVTSTQRLVLNTRWGDVRIGSGDVHEITGSVSVTAWAADDEAASDIAESVGVTHYREGDTLFVHCEIPDSSNRTRFRADFDLTVPRDLEVSVKGMSGDYSVSGAGSGVNAVNLSGDIIVQRSSGIIALESKSGDIEILDCEGEIRAHSLSGDINLEGVRSVKAQTRTVSGDIMADIRPDGDAQIELRSTSGDIRARFPEDSGLEISAETTSGEVTVELSLESSERSAHRVVGKRAGGGTQVRVESKSGDISLGSL